MTVEWLADLRQAPSTKSGTRDVILYRIGREGTTLVAEWPGLASLRCTTSRDAVFRGEEGADPRLVAKVEAGLARALVRSLDGEITLHASAVACSGKAIACVGASGDGKSSLAAALCRITGVTLLADDMAPLAIDPAIDASPVQVLPSERAVWLHREDQIYKDPILLPYASEPAELEALVTLAFDDAAAIRLERLKPAALLGRLVPGLVRFALDDPAAHARELSALASLCRRVPGYELRRPRDHGRLEETANRLAPLFAGAAAGYI